jgi:hypothetical protein
MTFKFLFVAASLPGEGSEPTRFCDDEELGPHARTRRCLMVGNTGHPLLHEPAVAYLNGSGNQGVLTPSQQGRLQ